jgi:tetratricopeptide (TPR) repeat protein
MLTVALRESLDQAQGAVDIDPGCWSAWQVLGITLYHARQWDGARSAFAHALTIWPSSYWTWLALSQLETSLADRKEAARDAFGDDHSDHRHAALEYLGWARHHLSQLQRCPGVQSFLDRLDALHADPGSRRGI